MKNIDFAEWLIILLIAICVLGLYANVKVSSDYRKKCLAINGQPDTVYRSPNLCLLDDGRLVNLEYK